MEAFQCVPNFSTSSNKIINKMANKAKEYTQVKDKSCDKDHNRGVITLIGSGDNILNAIIECTKIAIENIDMNQHKGIHPRIGAIDVIPVVPLYGVNMKDAIELSRKIGIAICKLGIPVYYYEESALKYKFLEDIRKGGLEYLKNNISKRMPDLGETLHPTAGATAVGAREPLIAYNVNLTTQDLNIAKIIASEIRTERKKGNKKFQGVKAMGIYLEKANIIQVSTNITRPYKTGVYPIFKYIKNRAKELGSDIKCSELIGVIPKEIACDIIKDSLIFSDFSADKII